jgi:PH (Pleckstrin Homology) domain-containing protein
VSAELDSDGVDGANVTEMSARPQRTALIANISAAAALVIFIVVALVMKRDNAGAVFGYKDQLFTVVIGLIVAGGLRLPARPRMRADREAVYLRSYLGNWRTVPWAAVTAVEFPSNVRFARLALPGDEGFAVYAIQRFDRDYAVEKMRALRALFAATHPVS